MPITASIKIGYARPILGNNHHFIPVGFTVTGGSNQYQKQLNGGSWVDFNLSSPVLDGFVVQWTVVHDNYTFGVRDKNNTGDVVTFSGYEVPYNPEFPEETDTPKIISTSITAGANKTLSITTKNPLSLVKVYGTILSGTEEWDYFNTNAVLTQGYSDTNGNFIATIPSTLRTGQKIIVTAKDPSKSESIATNQIIVGGARNNQLNISYVQGSSTANGRLLQINISGGTAPYQWSTNNDEVWTTVPTTPIDYPYGVDWIVFRDATNSIFAFTIKVFDEVAVISNTKYLSTYELIPEIIVTKNGQLAQLSKRSKSNSESIFYYVLVDANNVRKLRTAKIGEKFSTQEAATVPDGWSSTSGSNNGIDWDGAVTLTTCNVNNTTTFLVAVTGNGATAVEFQFDSNTTWLPANVGGFNNRFTITAPSNGIIRQFKARKVGTTAEIFGFRQECIPTTTPTSQAILFPFKIANLDQAYFLNKNTSQFKSKVKVSGLRVWDEAWSVYNSGGKAWCVNLGKVKETGVLDITFPSSYVGQEVHIRIFHYNSSTLTDANIIELNDYVIQL